MPAVFDYHLTVGARDIDVLGHVNNLAYLRWMIDAATSHSAAQGWSQAAHLALGSGWVVREHRIRYLKPAMPGDDVTIRTWVSDWHRVTTLREFEFYRTTDAARLAIAQTQWAYVNFSTGLPMRPPDAVTQAFEVIERTVGLQPRG